MIVLFFLVACVCICWLNYIFIKIDHIELLNKFDFASIRILGTANHYIFFVVPMYVLYPPKVSSSFHHFQVLRRL